MEPRQVGACMLVGQVLWRRAEPSGVSVGTASPQRHLDNQKTKQTQPILEHYKYQRFYGCAVAKLAAELAVRACAVKPAKPLAGHNLKLCQCVAAGASVMLSCGCIVLGCVWRGTGKCTFTRHLQSSATQK